MIPDPKVTATRSARGFTLIELCVSLTIASIAVLTVLPNIARMTTRSRVIETSRQVAAALQLARMRAINERVPYAVSFSSTGFNLYQDTNGNQVRDTSEPWLY